MSSARGAVAIAAMALAVGCGAGYAGGRVSGQQEGLKRGQSQMQAVAAKAGLDAWQASSDHDALVSQLAQANAKIGQQGQVIKGMQRVLDAPRPPSPTVTVTAPPACPMVQVRKLRADLKSAGDRINPTSYINPPQLDPFGDFMLALSRAREEMSQASDALGQMQGRCP